MYKRKVLGQAVLDRITSLQKKHPYRNIPSLIGGSLKPLNTDEKLIECKETHEEERKNAIKVVIRVRPIVERESKHTIEQCISVVSSSRILVTPPCRYEVSDDKMKNPHRKNRGYEKEYEFDNILDSISSQDDVYSNTVSDLIDGVMLGYNATIFAYGATGAGKTYTMLGYSGKLGLMPLSVCNLLKKIMEASSRQQHTLYMSYLEVYNENIKDLLCTSETPTSLELREDPQKGVVVAGLSELMVTSEDEVMRRLKKGDQLRTKEMTLANDVSSRSHAALQLVIETKDVISGDVNFAKLILVDLAGSERAAFAVYQFFNNKINI